jgi:hypothetical protein
MLGEKCPEVGRFLFELNGNCAMERCVKNIRFLSRALFISQSQRERKIFGAFAEKLILNSVSLRD